MPVYTVCINRDTGYLCAGCVECVELSYHLEIIHQLPWKLCIYMEMEVTYIIISHILNNILL